MTPIKSIVLLGNTVLVRDHADKLELKAVCPNSRDAAWLASSLCEYHKVPLEAGLDSPVLSALVSR